MYHSIVREAEPGSLLPIEGQLSVFATNETHNEGYPGDYAEHFIENKVKEYLGNPSVYHYQLPIIKEKITEPEKAIQDLTR